MTFINPTLLCRDANNDTCGVPGDLNVSLQGGFLPNVFKVLSHRPAEFRAFFAYYNELMNKETGLYLFLCTALATHLCPFSQGSEKCVTS